MAKKKKESQSEPEPKVRSFETFRTVDNWERSQLEQDAPSCFNGIVRVEKYRITIEKLDEPKEVVAARLYTLWVNSDNHHHREPLLAEARRLGIDLPNGDFRKNNRGYK